MVVRTRRESNPLIKHYSGPRGFKRLVAVEGGVAWLIFRWWRCSSSVVVVVADKFFRVSLLGSPPFKTSLAVNVDELPGELECWWWWWCGELSVKVTKPNETETYRRKILNNGFRRIRI